MQIEVEERARPQSNVIAVITVKWRSYDHALTDFSQLFAQENVALASGQRERRIIPT
jgi:hypothetical protein